MYYSQSGDTLRTVAIHFGVDVSEITSTNPLPVETSLLTPDTLLFIPDLLEETTSDVRILPDSEMVFSRSAIEFDIESYVKNGGGKLSTDRIYLNDAGWLDGAQEVQKIAIESSINPRLLLALIQYRSGWVYGQPSNLFEEIYPLGYNNYFYQGLYGQMKWVVQQLAMGYYGWREGSLTELTLTDGTVLRINPYLNAGTVAVYYYFSQCYAYNEWLQAIEQFSTLYNEMFGDVWALAAPYEPLFSAEVSQPDLTLPFKVGELWSFSGGPHSAWFGRIGYNEIPQPRAAVDFAPGAAQPGCVGENPNLILAPAGGKVVRVGTGLVVLDLNGDGFEQTGWVLIFMHVSTKDRAALGAYLNAGDVIGHPSCEGGVVDGGPHVHIARKYNGEWVLADGPLPFTLSGWVIHAGADPYQGTMTKGDRVIIAKTTGTKETQIIRQPDE